MCRRFNSAPSHHFRPMESGVPAMLRKSLNIAVFVLAYLSGALRSTRFASRGPRVMLPAKDFICGFSTRFSLPRSGARLHTQNHSADCSRAWALALKPTDGVVTLKPEVKVLLDASQFSAVVHAAVERKLSPGDALGQFWASDKVPDGLNEWPTVTRARK